MSSRVVRSVVSSLAVAMAVSCALTAVPRRARADEKSVCLESYVSAQKDRRSAHLREAAIELTRCGASACPGTLRDDCVRWYAEVQAATPSLVISFTDRDGKDRSDVAVTVDGERRAGALDGRALAVDPGTHRLALMTVGGESFATAVLVREGEHDRRVIVQAPPRAAAGVSGGSRPVPPLAWTLGGVGLAGLATWGGFGLAALYAHPGLDTDLARCKPSCASGDVSTVRSRFIVADVGAGVGLLTLAGAAFVLFTRPSATPATTALVPDVSFGREGVRAAIGWTFR